MTTTHERYGRRRVDLASLALLLIGVGSSAASYWLITVDGLNPLLLIPGVVAAVIGVTHLVKTEAPRE